MKAKGLHQLMHMTYTLRQTHHLNLLPQQPAILLHLLGQLYRLVPHAASILVEACTVEGWLGTLLEG